jgi:undecaprenyl-diphosphatase
MNILQAIILGTVQGLAEFLPISSSGHLSIVSQLLGLHDTGAAFSGIIQIGTEAAVIIYFYKDIARIFLAWAKSLAQLPGTFGKKGCIRNLEKDAQMGWFILFGTLPIIFAGVVLKNLIENQFRTLYLTAGALIVFGIILWFVDSKMPDNRELHKLNVRQSLWFGFAQCLALVPGVSRSGATMTLGRFLGFDRKSAAKFSFYLAIPSVFGAAFFEIISVFRHNEINAPNFPGWTPTIIATIVSFVVGYLVIAVFMRVISKISYRPFAIYRIVFGVLVIGLLLSNVIA